MGWPLALAVGFSVPSLAQTLPQGGTVVGGAGSITQTAPNQLTINQASQNLAIDWQSFSIGANNIVRFVQPSTSAVALNRVLNGDPSQIYGQIQANGQVVIMSPNGIVFGPNSRVDVNALVATTANISTLDFMAGKLLFDQASADANARVVNQGVISVAQGGFAVLAAANVSNQGQIIANGGTVVLGGTKTFAIDFHGDGLLKFAATGMVDQKPAGADALVENSGSIEANGGRVLLTARAARSVLDNVINTSGIVVAHTAALVNGEIVIDGGDSGIVHVAGTLDASGAAAGETGGTVKVLGEKVGLFENARIDASGNAGGGTVLVGGNYQGAGPEPNSKMLYMDARAVIDASSASGDGGRVILWSDLATRNAGHINVSGARDGGFIEVSSKGYLDFRGTVDLRGLAGQAGNLLLDPTDITITAGASSGGMSAGSPFAGTAATSNLDVAVLNAALTGGTVTVTTASAAGGTGNIDITASIVNQANGTNLILRADGAITVGAGGYISGGGYTFNVSLRAAGNITVGGTGIATNGGSLTTESAGGGGQAGGNFVSTASINTNAGNVTLAHTGTISIGAALNTTGQLSINAGGATTQSAAITGPASLVIGGTGAVTLGNAGNSFSNITLGRTGTTTDVSIVNAISGSFQTSTLGSGTFTYSSATAGFLQSGGITQDAGGGAVSISGGTGAVTLGQANSFSGPVTVTGDSITVSAAQSATGAGSISLQAARNVVVSANLTTAGGDILITGNVTSWVTPTVSAPTYAALSGSFDGVAVNAGVSINANGGAIAIAGMGGDTGANQHGVRMYAAAATPTTLATTGTGTITVYGRGGASTSNAGGGLGGSHGGFRFDGNATGVVDVSTVNGNIKMVGAGGGVGITSDNNGGGVFFHTKVRATGSGAIDIAGTPGVGASIGLAAFFAQTEISAVSGNIALTGTSGAAFVNDGAFAGSASGLRIGGATVRTTGTGNVTLRGIDGTEGPGILISDVNGTSTLGNAAMNGDLTLRANSLTYAGTNTITNSGSGRIIFRTDTDATTIGVAGGAGTLQVPTSILSAATGFFNAQIGSISQTGTITAGAGWTLARSTTLLTGTGNVTVASVALAGNQLTFNAGGTVSQTGAISGAGSVYLAGAGNTTLNNGGNSFTDLSFQMTGTAGNVNIATTGALFVGSSTIGTGTLSLTGAGITQSGPLIQDVGGGTVTLIATGGNSITLTNLSNAFRGDVLMTTTGSGNASISHQFIALQLGASSVGGNLTVVSGSALTQAGTLTVGGAANFTAGAATLDLSTNGAANSFGGPVALTNSGGANVLINSSGGLTLGAVSTVGDLIVTAGGSITQSAAISVSGAATLTSSGGNITLSQINSFGGAVTVTGDSISVTGSLTMTGIGNLTLAASGAIGIGAAGSLAATGSGSVWIAAANNIVIDGSITTNGGGITIWGNAPGGSSTAGTAAGTAWGVQINATAMISSAAGAISIVGKGALDNVTGQHGIVLWQGGTVQSTTGGITLLGRGGDGSAGGIGIAVVGGTIQSASGVVSLTGYAGNSGANADGIQLSNGADIHSDSGAMTLTGVGSGSGFGFAAAGTISTIGDPASTENISLIADTVSVSVATLGIETSGQVLFRPVNSGTTIGVGGGAGTLQLPSDMSFVDAGLLVVGDVAAGAIEVGAGGVTVAVGTDLGLRGASIALTGDVTLGPVDTLTLYANTGGVTQAAGSTISAANLVLRGAGDFAVNRGGTGYNDITNVAADVTAGSGSGAIVIYTGSGGGSSSNALTDGVGTVNGISTPGGLTWVALNGLSQTGAGLISVGGVANLTAQNGTLDMSVATNSFGGPVAATSAGGGSVLLRGGSLTLGIVNSAGNVILNATSGGINQTGLLTANGNLNASANGGPLALSSYQNVVAGSVSLATSGGKNNIAWTQSGPMLVGGISSSGQLNLSVTGGGISQAGPISTGDPTTLSVDTGNIALTNGANAFFGAITATNTAGGISIANTGDTVFGNIVSNGVLNVSVTGGTLTQTNATAITTTGNATVTLAGAYALTLTESGNNVGGNLALSGSTGTLDGTISGTVAVTTGTFVVNGTTIVGAPPSNSTAPAPGAGAGGSTISSALTDAAPISQIQGAAALPPSPPPGATAVVSDTVALLTGGPGPLVAGGAGAPSGPAGPAEGGEGGPAVSPAGVVLAPSTAPASTGPGAPSPAAAQQTPAIVTSGGPPPPGTTLVPTTAPTPAVLAVGNVGGASAPAVNGGVPTGGTVLAVPPL